EVLIFVHVSKNMQDKISQLTIFRCEACDCASLGRNFINIQLTFSREISNITILKLQ
ncbi:hypothetical protein GOODEAATRI_029231, partial [Goodea atripinnis]